MTIRELQAAAHANSVSHGWWDQQRRIALTPEGEDLDKRLVLATIPEKLCLVHSEVSEALEDYRDGTMITVVNNDGKPEGFPSELADILIRILDLCGALGIDLETEVKIKMAYNATRPYRHGGKVC